MKKCQLYRHFGADNVLLYIGVSNNALRRAGAHASRHWASQIGRIEISEFEDRKDALEAERIAIRDERPLFNVVHSFPPRPYNGKKRGRKKEFPVRITLPLAEEMAERIDRALSKDEGRVELIREAIERELKRRARK